MTHPPIPPTPTPPRQTSPRLAYWTSWQGIVCIVVIVAAASFVALALAGPYMRPKSDPDASAKILKCAFVNGVATTEVGVNNVGVGAKRFAVTVEIKNPDREVVATKVVAFGPIPTNGADWTEVTVPLKTPLDNGFCRVSAVAEIR